MVSMNLPVVIAIINGIESFWSYVNEGSQNSIVFHEQLFI